MREKLSMTGSFFFYMGILEYDCRVQANSKYLAEMGFEQTVSYLSVAIGTVWRRRKRIQCKCNLIMGTDY